MVLTDKCKEDFLDYYYENLMGIHKIYDKEQASEFFNLLIPLYQRAAIIQFFDSERLHIHLKRNCTGAKFNFWYCTITNTDGVYLNNSFGIIIEEDSREEIEIEAIKEANRIYNLR